MSILYDEDVAKNNALIDYDTPNLSFLRMSIVLKRMGIHNNYFFLSLLDPKLKGVNPHSEDLTLEQQARIVTECKRNIWYFVREVVRIPVAGDEHGIPYVLNRGNLAFIWSFMNDVDVGWIMPRQTGKTYGTQVVVCYMMYVMGTNLDIGMFTKDATLVQDNVSRLKELKEGLPKWMIVKSSTDSDRKEGLFYAGLNNEYKTFTSANDENGAFKLGRGATMAVIHFDEIAFMNYNWIVVPTAVNSMLAASNNARKHGLPSPIVYTTTAGNPDIRQGAFALDIFMKAAPFYEAMYDVKNRDELLKVIAKNSSSASPMLYLEFSYKQLGKDDTWLQQAAARANLSQDDIDRDLLNIWKSSSDNAILTEEMRRKIRNSLKEPLYTDISDGFMIKWYVKEEVVKSSKFRNSPIALGLDTSENIGRDFTTMTFTSFANMATLATCRCNESNTMEVARFIFKLMIRFPGLILVPERKSTGVVIIDYLLEVLADNNINPFFRIYNEVIQNLGDPKYASIDIYSYKNLIGRVRAVFGFLTTASSRTILYKNVMMKMLELNADRIYDRTLISEYCNLTLRAGRIDHESGKHDDQVISHLLANYFIFYGKNLRSYGVADSQVLNAIDSVAANISSKERANQISIRRRIAELQSKMNDNISYVLRQAYERELNYLNTLVDDSVIEVAPLAMTQVKYENNQINSNISAESSIKNFARRFLR